MAGAKMPKVASPQAKNGMAEIELAEAVDVPSEQVDGRPEQRSADDHGLARKVISEPAGDWRGAHVGDEEEEGQRPKLRVGDVELALDLLLHAGDDVAVDVVDEVERRQQGKGDGGSGNGFGLRGRLRRHGAEMVAGAVSTPR